MAGSDRESPRVLATRALQARGPDADACTAIVARLQRRTDQAAFEAARDLARSDSLPERVLGLAQRKDPSALAPMLAGLNDRHPGNLVVESAAEALPALQRLKNEGWQERDRRPSLLDRAIEACSR